MRGSSNTPTAQHPNRHTNPCLTLVGGRSLATADEDAIEEERRLLFVAMSRAREGLYLSHAKRRMFRGRHVAMKPSRFLEELPEVRIKLVEFNNRPSSPSLPKLLTPDVLIGDPDRPATAHQADVEVKVGAQREGQATAVFNTSHTCRGRHCEWSESPWECD